MIRTYQLIPHNGELFILLQCDLDMALTIERHSTWQCGEPVCTDVGFLYQVKDTVTESILCLINYDFTECRENIAILERMGERLTLHADGSHIETLQSTYGWPYGSPHTFSNRVAMYDLEDNEMIFSDIKRFLTNNNLMVIEW